MKSTGFHANSRLVILPELKERMVLMHAQRKAGIRERAVQQPVDVVVEFAEGFLGCLGVDAIGGRRFIPRYQ